MPQFVNLPDGSQVGFPDTMDDVEILDVLRTKFPPTGGGRTPAAASVDPMTEARRAGYTPTSESGVELGSILRGMLGGARDTMGATLGAFQGYVQDPLAAAAERGDVSPTPEDTSDPLGFNPEGYTPGGYLQPRAKDIGSGAFARNTQNLLRNRGVAEMMQPFPMTTGGAPSSEPFNEPIPSGMGGPVAALETGVALGTDPTTPLAITNPVALTAIGVDSAINAWERANTPTDSSMGLGEQETEDWNTLIQAGIGAAATTGGVHGAARDIRAMRRPPVQKTVAPRAAPDAVAPPEPPLPDFDTEFTAPPATIPRELSSGVFGGPPYDQLLRERQLADVLMEPRMERPIPGPPVTDVDFIAPEIQGPPKPLAPTGEMEVALDRAIGAKRGLSSPKSWQRGNIMSTMMKYLEPTKAEVAKELSDRMRTLAGKADEDFAHYFPSEVELRDALKYARNESARRGIPLEQLYPELAKFEDQGGLKFADVPLVGGDISANLTERRTTPVLKGTEFEGLGRKPNPKDAKLGMGHIKIQDLRRAVKAKKGRLYQEALRVTRERMMRDASEEYASRVEAEEGRFEEPEVRDSIEPEGEVDTSFDPTMLSERIGGETPPPTPKRTFKDTPPSGPVSMKLGGDFNISEVTSDLGTATKLYTEGHLPAEKYIGTALDNVVAEMRNNLPRGLEHNPDMAAKLQRTRTREGNAISGAALTEGVEGTYPRITTDVESVVHNHVTQQVKTGKVPTPETTMRFILDILGHELGHALPEGAVHEFVGAPPGSPLAATMGSGAEHLHQTAMDITTPMVHSTSIAQGMMRSVNIKGSPLRKAIMALLEKTAPDAYALGQKMKGKKTGSLMERLTERRADAEQAALAKVDTRAEVRALGGDVPPDVFLKDAQKPESIWNPERTMLADEGIAEQLKSSSEAEWKPRGQKKLFGTGVDQVRGVEPPKPKQNELFPAEELRRPEPKNPPDTRQGDLDLDFDTDLTDERSREVLFAAKKLLRLEAGDHLAETLKKANKEGIGVFRTRKMNDVAAFVVEKLEAGLIPKTYEGVLAAVQEGMGRPGGRATQVAQKISERYALKPKKMTSQDGALTAQVLGSLSRMMNTGGKALHTAAEGNLVFTAAGEATALNNLVNGLVHEGMQGVVDLTFSPFSKISRERLSGYLPSIATLFKSFPTAIYRYAKIADSKNATLHEFLKEAEAADMVTQVGLDPKLYNRIWHHTVAGVSGSGPQSGRGLKGAEKIWQFALAPNILADYSIFMSTFTREMTPTLKKLGLKNIQELRNAIKQNPVLLEAVRDDILFASTEGARSAQKLGPAGYSTDPSFPAARGVERLSILLSDFPALQVVTLKFSNYILNNMLPYIADSLPLAFSEAYTPIASSRTKLSIDYPGIKRDFFLAQRRAEVLKNNVVNLRPHGKNATATNIAAYDAAKQLLADHIRATAKTRADYRRAQRVGVYRKSDVNRQLAIGPAMLATFFLYGMMTKDPTEAWDKVKVGKNREGDQLKKSLIPALGAMAPFAYLGYRMAQSWRNVPDAVAEKQKINFRDDIEQMFGARTGDWPTFVTAIFDEGKYTDEVYKEVDKVGIGQGRIATQPWFFGLARRLGNMLDPRNQLETSPKIDVPDSYTAGDIPKRLVHEAALSAASRTPGVKQYLPPKYDPLSGKQQRDEGGIFLRNQVFSPLREFVDNNKNLISYKDVHFTQSGAAGYDAAAFRYIQGQIEKRINPIINSSRSTIIKAAEIKREMGRIRDEAGRVATRSGAPIPAADRRRIREEERKKAQEKESRILSRPYSSRGAARPLSSSEKKKAAERDTISSPPW